MIDQNLTAQNISKSFKEKEVLKNMNLTLEPNKIYGLIGRNGVGKTTLLSVLSAQSAATKGKVFLGEMPVWENQEVLDHICFSREINGNTMVQSLTVKKYLWRASVYYPNWDEEYAKRLVREFDLDMKQRIAKLSKGMTSMLTIITALASRADYTFLDEPAAGLDIIAREQFYDLLLEEYSRSGRTFVVSTHIVDEAERIFEEVIILKDGTILLKEDTQELLGRCLHVSGLDEEVKKCTAGCRTFQWETFGRNAGVTVLLEPGETLPGSGKVDVMPVNLQKAFTALCGKGES